MCPIVRLVIVHLIAASGAVASLAEEGQPEQEAAPAVQVHFQEQIIFERFDQDISQMCRVASVRGCTRFPAESFEYTCSREGDGWRLRFIALVEAEILVAHASTVMHERQHLLHLREMLAGYLRKMTVQLYPSEARCKVLAEVLSRPENVRAVMDDLRMASNEKFLCDRPGRILIAKENGADVPILVTAR